ncbi:cytochrome P450 [Aspergillus venezuelensis]
MPSQQFYLLGEPVSSARTIELDDVKDLDDLRTLIAAHFAIVEPSGIDFSSNNTFLTSIPEITSSPTPISITIDGHAIRDVPSPTGLPIVGNYFQIFPDHLGNHQRLFEQYGPLIRTNTMGRIVYHTNDPALSAIFFSESDFFTKKINESHPLFSLKTPAAGVFLADTDTPEWRVAHKFLPPALGPKAVRHYAPTMQKTVEDAYKVFDKLDEEGEAWNVYQYMLKLGSQAVGKLTLGIDFEHFGEVDSPIHEMVHLIAEMLSLNKKVTSMGDWYAMLPFGDPKRLKDCRKRIEGMVTESIDNAAKGGVEDLPLQDAALKASNMVDYAIRATDSKGEKLPTTSLVWALVVATAAGFTTTSSLLSWLIYGLVTYPDMQDRLLQELVDNDFDENTELTAEYTEKLTFLDKYIKETQRRHNPSFQPGRTAKVDLILPGGYKMPKESVAIPALHHIHNNPSLWDNPARFNPERWDTEEVKNRHRAAYVPFGAGPRMCIGFNFALQEVKIFLPKLIYRYKFTREGDETIDQNTAQMPPRQICAASTSTPRLAEPVCAVEPSNIVGSNSGDRTLPPPRIPPFEPARAFSEPVEVSSLPTPQSENTRTEDEERSAADFATASLRPRDAGATDMPIYTGGDLGFGAFLDVIAPQAVPRHIFRPVSHPTLNNEDIEYFKFKGCLNLPSKDVCLELLHAYFYNVHPIMPVVDAAQVMGIEHLLDRPAELNLLLLWSIFFAAVNFIPTDTCTLAGYSSRKEMKEAMYSRAKVLHNNGGGDRITEMQSALLLGFWHSEMNNHAQPWYWTGVAISLGHIMGLHRDPDAVKYNATIADRQRALWRRLWWSCVYRDRWLSLTLGRPLRINLRDCDVAMPSVTDVLCDLAEIHPSTSASLIPEDLPQLTEYWITLLQLSKTLGDVLTLSYQPQGSNPTLSQVEELETEALGLNVPRHCSPSLTPRSKFAVYHLQLHHQACLITFYRRLTNRIPEGVPTTEHRAYQDMVRTQVEAAAQQTNTVLDCLAREQLLHLAGPMTPPLLVPAMHIHLMNCKSSNPLTQQLSRNKLEFCLLILKVMRDVHSSASYYRALFSEAVRHVFPESTSGPSPSLPERSDAGVSSTAPGAPAIDTFLSGNFFDDLMDEASFFNFWDSLNQM